MQATVTRAYSKYFFASTILLAYVPTLSILGSQFERARMWLVFAGCGFLGVQMALMVKGAREMKEELFLSVEDDELALNGGRIVPGRIAKVRLNRNQLYVMLKEGGLSDRSFKLKTGTELETADAVRVLRAYCGKHGVVFED